MTANLVGAFAFGFIVGWVTYRTMRRTKPNGLSDLATVIGAIGGATVTGLFPKESTAFGWYAIGLAIGFMLYLVVSYVMAKKEKLSINDWLGEPPVIGDRGGGGQDPINP